jgi:hypothetical protein
MELYGATRGVHIVACYSILIPKPPRWISTVAGLWAWQAHGAWRAIAANALSVRERSQLLAEAEQLHGSAIQAPDNLIG